MHLTIYITAIVLEEYFSGNLVSDMKVNLPADEVWDVYRSKDFGDLLLKLLPGYFKAIDVVTGDGGVGSIIKVTLQPGLSSQPCVLLKKMLVRITSTHSVIKLRNFSSVSGTSSWLDQIVELDDKTMTRILHRVQGGHLDNGFTLFDAGYRVVKKEKNSCVIKAITSFQIRADSLANASVMQPGWTFSITIANYVNSLKT